jgi:predicted double-glycine peptidase
MRKLIAATLASVAALAAFGARSYSAGGVVTTWSVSGIENAEGSYTGTAELTLTQLDAKLVLTATTATGLPISWSGHGKLDAGQINLTLDPGFVAPGATASFTSGKAEYVLGDDGTLAGSWALTSSTKKKAGPGGTETLTLVSGTAPLAPSTPGTPRPHLPTDALPVPMVTQPDEYSCGAASLQAVLYYYRVSDGDLHTLYKPLGTKATNGTEPPPIVAFAQSKGLTANFVRGTSVGLADLQQALAGRDPVMLVIQAWKGTTTPWTSDEDDAHWVVLVGMDANYAYFMDPWAHFGLGYMPLPELLERWHCEEGTHKIEHEAIFFHGLAPTPGDGLVRMQ